MNYFGIKLGLDGGDQAKMIDVLRSSGCETIQVSDGLAIKTDKSSQEVSEILGEQFRGQIEALSAEIRTRFPQ